MKLVVRAGWALLALTATVSGAVPALRSAAYAQAGLEVQDIQFEGNRRYSSETVRQALRTKRGAKLDRALLNRDIEELYRFFDTVELVETTTPEGVVLLFKVTENPQITALAFRGNDRFSDSELDREIKTGRGLPLKKAEVENDRATLLRMYRRAGYHFVEVNAEVVDEAGGKSVTFVIYEGPEVCVDTITFEGAQAFKKEKLLEHMATRETGFLSLSSGLFDEGELEKDLLALRNFYRSEGYLNARADLVDTQFTDDREYVDLTIAISEGDAYAIGDIRIEGDENFPGGEEALREFLTVESGARRRQFDVSRSIDALEDAYRDEGYAAVEVQADEIVPAEGLAVELVFKVTEKAKVYVRNIDVTGNQITRQDVILRELNLRPGDVLNANEMRKGRQRLLGLDYFRDVQVRAKDLPPGEDPTQKDVEVEVDDTATTGQVRFAIGFSTDFGAQASLAVTKRNFDWRDWPERFGDVFTGRAFSGGGQTFQLELAPGSQVSAYRVAYTQPWLFDKPITFGWDAFIRQFSRFDYDVDRRGVDFTLGRRWIIQGKKDDTVVSLGGVTRVENIDVTHVQRGSASTAFLAENDNSLISQRLTTSLDTRDHPLRPTNGWFASYSSEIGLAGDVRFWRNELEVARHFRLYTDAEERHHVLSLHARVGTVKELGSSVRADPNVFGESYVPIYERYFAGGGTDNGNAVAVRGFGYGGAGPHGQGNPFESKRLARQGRTVISALENDGDPLGGDFLLGGSAEYGFPLFEEILRGVFFVDAGMVRDALDNSHGLDRSAVDDLRGKLIAKGTNQGKPRLLQLARRIEYDDGPSLFSDLRVSAGIGLRIRIPVFGPTPIALDFGFPIRDQSGDDRQVLTFSIARDF